MYFIPLVGHVCVLKSGIHIQQIKESNTNAYAFMRATVTSVGVFKRWSAPGCGNKLDPSCP